MLNHRRQIIFIILTFACAETILSGSALAQERAKESGKASLFSKQNYEEIFKLVKEKPVASTFFAIVSLVAICATVAGIVLIFWYLINKVKGRELLLQSPINDVSWRMSDGVIVLGCYVYLFFAIPIVVGFMLDKVNIHGRQIRLLGLLISALVNVATILLLFWIIKFLRGGFLSELGFKRGNYWRNLKIGVIAYLMVLPILMGAAFLVQHVLHLLGKEPVAQELVVFIMKEKSSMVLSFLIIYGALIGPVLEEILFRGFLQSALRQRLGSKAAIGVTAFFFTLMHHEVSVFVPILILGVTLGVLYERTQSLLTSITLHVLNNSAMMIILMADKAILSA